MDEQGRCLDFVGILQWRMFPELFCILFSEESGCAALIRPKVQTDIRDEAHAGFPNGLGISEQETAAKIDQESDESIRRLIIELSGQPVGEMCCRNMGDHTADIGIKICDASQQEHAKSVIISPANTFIDQDAKSAGTNIT